MRKGFPYCSHHASYLPVRLMHGRMLGGLLHVGTRTPRIIFSCGAMALLREAARGPSRLACQLKCTAHQKSEASQQKYARSRLQKKLVTCHCLPDSRGAMIQAGGTACVGTLIRSIDARAAASPLRVTRASSLRVRCARPAHGASPTLPPRAAGKADDLSECLIITVP